MLLMQVNAASTGVYDAPRPDAGLDTQLLYGETFEIHSPLSSEWVEGQAIHDGYPGCVRLEHLAKMVVEPTHRVAVARTVAYTFPDMKKRKRTLLGMNALVRIEDERDGFLLDPGAGWVYEDELMPIDRHPADYVAEAEKMLGTPYLWGGRDACEGIDCSGLVQAAFMAIGHEAPRNSGPQEKELGIAYACDANHPLRRGDLVFWPRHVGIMQGPEDILHATADRHRVVSEKLSAVIERRRQQGSEISMVKRVPWQPREAH